MKPKNTSSSLLIFGLAFPVIGLATDQTAFSWVAIAFVVLSLILGAGGCNPGSDSLLSPVRSRTLQVR